MLLLAALAALTPTQAIAELREVDRIVDARVTYRPDPLGGSLDVWRVARTRGDCEDYALAKRELLIRRGWDPDDLQILYLQRTTPAGTRLGHAVLMSREYRIVLDQTDEGSPRGGIAWPIDEYLALDGYEVYCVFRDIKPGVKDARARC